MRLAGCGISGGRAVRVFLLLFFHGSESGVFLLNLFLRGNPTRGGGFCFNSRDNIS